MTQISQLQPAGVSVWWNQLKPSYLRSSDLKACSYWAVSFNTGVLRWEPTPTVEVICNSFRCLKFVVLALLCGYHLKMGMLVSCDFPCSFAPNDECFHTALCCLLLSTKTGCEAPYLQSQMSYNRKQQHRANETSIKIVMINNMIIISLIFSLYISCCITDFMYKCTVSTVMFIKSCGWSYSFTTSKLPSQCATLDTLQSLQKHQTLTCSKPQFSCFFLRFCAKFCGVRYCCVSVCSVASGPVHGVGLVDLPGRLWSANLQIPESEPSHCLGSTGEVSACDTVWAHCWGRLYSMSTSVFKVQVALKYEGETWDDQQEQQLNCLECKTSSNCWCRDIWLQQEAT